MVPEVGGWIGTLKRATTSTGGTTQEVPNAKTGCTEQSRSLTEHGTTTWSCSNMDSGTRTTMDEYVNAEHIRAFTDDGSVEILDSTISAEAERHLERSFPLRSWSTIIDWDKLPSTMLEW